MAGRADYRVGLLAGTGSFPELVAAEIKTQGHELICVQVAGSAGRLGTIADHYRQCPPGALGEAIGTMRAHGVREVVIAGRFRRADLLAEGDALRDAALAGVDDRRDAQAFQRLTAVLDGLGIVLVEQTRFVGHLLAPPGVLTARAPTPDEAADIRFATPIARAMADLDVGQTVVVRGGLILAVEAAEGTDATIRRAGAILTGGVVVKVSRRLQDPRFDIPAVGPGTIASMREAGARALAIDGRRTLVVDRARVIADADAAAIAVVAADTPPLGTPVDARP
jgi:DUF1009 family protein